MPLIPPAHRPIPPIGIHELFNDVATKSFPDGATAALDVVQLDSYESLYNADRFCIEVDGADEFDCDEASKFYTSLLGHNPDEDPLDIDIAPLVAHHLQTSFKYIAGEGWIIRDNDEWQPTSLQEVHKYVALVLRCYAKFCKLRWANKGDNRVTKSVYNLTSFGTSKAFINVLAYNNVLNTSETILESLPGIKYHMKWANGVYDHSTKAPTEPEPVSDNGTWAAHNGYNFDPSRRESRHYKGLESWLKAALRDNPTDYLSGTTNYDAMRYVCLSWGCLAATCTHAPCP